MNIAMTVQTCPGKHFIRGGSSLKSFETSIGSAGMELLVVTVLAELRRPHAQEFVVIAAVGDMTV